MYETTFKVRGAGAFPVDMLRRARCYPRTEADAELIALPNPGPETREVVLTKTHVYKLDTQLDPRRWASFGWELLAVPTRSLKFGTWKL